MIQASRRVPSHSTEQRELEAVLKAQLAALRAEGGFFHVWLLPTRRRPRQRTMDALGSLVRKVPLARERSGVPGRRAALFEVDRYGRAAAWVKGKDGPPPH